MASALDDDTRSTINAGRETAGAMLRAAQKDLQKVFVIFLIGFLGTFYALNLYVWDFLKGVTRAQMEAQLEKAVSIIAQTPFDVILLQAKIGLVTGVVICLPAFLYVSRDALRERGLWPQRSIPWWTVVGIIVGMASLFAGGVTYGYFFFFPFTFSFLAQNAVNAGFAPTYSIVKWAEFIFLLTISFGLASQLPLVMPALSYAEIVPYETFREKWRYAVLGVFAAGAMFTPPDPFTQILWALPVLALYGVSLYLSKLVTIVHRGSAQLNFTETMRQHWNLVTAAGIGGGSLIYMILMYGGFEQTNAALATLESAYRVQRPESEATQALLIIAGGVFATLITIAGLIYRDIDTVAAIEAGIGNPSKIELSTLDEAGVRAAPPEVFESLSESDVMQAANQALDAGEKQKARVILDRHDATEADDSPSPEQADETESVSDRASRAGSAFLSEFADDEATAEESIDGYYADLTFILESLTSKAFRIVGFFMLVLAGAFGWLYTGGIKRVYDDFLRRLPTEVQPTEVLSVVALHPMEALIFEVKLSAIIAAIATVPLVAYYAWPALQERAIISQRREAVLGWTAALGGGLIGGFVLGYTTVAPTVISWLVNDALVANMFIAYRITNFFWLIFFTTAGIGILFDVPVLMILLNRARIPYQTMRNRWREVTVAMLALAAIFTPADIMTMFLVTIPLMLAYGIGLAVLYVLTIGGTRELGPAQHYRSEQESM